MNFTSPKIKIHIWKLILYAQYLLSNQSIGQK
jgi:hypothetical protein